MYGIKDVGSPLQGESNVVGVIFCPEGVALGYDRYRLSGVSNRLIPSESVVVARILRILELSVLSRLAHSSYLQNHTINRKEET